MNSAMSSYAGLLQQAFFIGSLVVILTSIFTALGYTRFRMRIGRLEPHAQARILLFLCMLPLLTAFVVIGSALLPSVLQLLGLESDHCLGHEEHQHFCLIHRPEFVASVPLNLVAGLFPVLLASIVSRVLADIAASRRFRAFLGDLPLVQSDGPVRILESSVPMAFTCGVIRPNAYFSTALLQSLTPEEIALLTSHELAHLQRGDNLLWLLARSFSLAHLPVVRRELLDRFLLSSEQACDQLSAGSGTGRFLMAELLVKVERLYRSRFRSVSPLTLNLVEARRNTVPARVQALMQPAPAGVASRVLPLVVFAVFIILLGGHDPLHGALEHAMSLLGG